MKHLTKKAAAVIVGNLILGTGASLLRLSGMGNEPYTAVNMAISDGLHINLGTYQLIANLVIFVVQLLFGRSYIGFGTAVNLFFLGYIIEYSGKLLESVLLPSPHAPLYVRLLCMTAGLLLLSFGIALYQTPNMGISPYDYLPFGMTEHLPTPYFINRMTTDGICVAIILLSLLSGFITWENSHLGVATILTACCLGPSVSFFTKFVKRLL